ncbi:ATP-binding protein [Microbacterium sp. NPDC028030]|uniref:ATP/GTP-binding protein n=1 Tax=Microbacterium sp. NPDC028030 TaxID=3155124 RepID=UPI0033D1D394
MKIAISGTYSTGKTTTSHALSHLTGVPRTHARTMRELLPDVAPGRRLEDCGVAELVQLGILRFSERYSHEGRLPEGFISDGSSLHEWSYGMIRAEVGINPEDPTSLPSRESGEAQALDISMAAIGAVVKRHATRSYDVFVHLPIEFPLVADGHRPVSEEFRQRSSDLLLDTLRELALPVHVVGGDLTSRLSAIVSTLALPQVMSIDEAVERAREDMSALDTRDETTRMEAIAGE